MQRPVRMAPTSDMRKGTEQRKPVQLAIAWKALEHRRFISRAWFARSEPCKEEEKVMKTTGFSGLVCVALAMFALPATAQTPDGMTPAEDGMCDVLTDATPGLYGLCVGMCEAQDCEAELNPFTGKVDFDPSCNPSSEQLLANYNRLAGPSDPGMPCVKIACPCWTEAEMENIAGGEIRDRPFDRCLLGETFSGLFGISTDGGDWEQAYALEGSKGPVCISIQTNPSTTRQRSISADELSVCQQSVIDECNARDLVR